MGVPGSEWEYLGVSGSTCEYCANSSDVLIRAHGDSREGCEESGREWCNGKVNCCADES